MEMRWKTVGWIYPYKVAPLKPIYDRAKSFYGKAHVEDHSNKICLISYSTEVASINKVTRKLVIYGLYSRTTKRHLYEFIRQMGYVATWDLTEYMQGEPR